MMSLRDASHYLVLAFSSFLSLSTSFVLVPALTLSPVKHIMSKGHVHLLKKFSLSDVVFASLPSFVKWSRFHWSLLYLSFSEASSSAITLFFLHYLAVHFPAPFLNAESSINVAECFVLIIFKLSATWSWNIPRKEVLIIWGHYQWDSLHWATCVKLGMTFTFRNRSTRFLSRFFSAAVLTSLPGCSYSLLVPCCSWEERESELASSGFSFSHFHLLFSRLWPR